MLFDSSIRKELGRHFGATLVVLVTVVMTMMLIRTLGQASKGVISPSDVMLIMGLTVLGHLATILSLSLFIALVATLSRMYRDSEMAIWFASGQGLIQQLRPMLRFGWPIVAAIAALTLLVWPWSNQQIVELRNQFEQRSDLDRIAPGEFQESSNGERVIFIEKDKKNNESASNIFILENKSDKETITSSKSAYLENENNYRFAILENGQRVEETHADGSVKITHFDFYKLLIQSKEAIEAEQGTRSISSAQLLGDSSRQEQAELGWRLSQPLLGFNLILLALSLTKTTPRTGQSLSIISALLAFIIYYNLVSVGQSWVAAGKISLPGFLIGLHGLIFAVACLGLTARQQQWSWVGIFSKK